MKVLVVWQDRYSTLPAGMLCLLIVISVTSPVRALDDFNASPVGGWGAIPPESQAKFFGLSAETDGTVTVIPKTGLTVTTNLLPAHVLTTKPRKLSHNHWESDFTPAQKTQANFYWNWCFDTKNGKTTKQSDATNTTNCYSTALGWIGSGTYRYWINITPAILGFSDDTKPIDKANATDNDRLFYKSQDHASILMTKTTDEDKQPTYTIRWKNNASGTYQATMLTDLSTPGMTKVIKKKGKAPTGDWGEIGTDANLVYADGTPNKVCRKK